MPTSSAQWEIAIQQQGVPPQPPGPVQKRTLGNDTLTYYEYDDVGRVSKVDNRKSDMSVISTFEYEHDRAGNPTKITREDGSATYYLSGKRSQEQASIIGPWRLASSGRGWRLAALAAGKLDEGPKRTRFR